MRLLPVISLMMNFQESSTTGYSPHELFMGRPVWFLHASYPEDSYSTVGRWVKCYGFEQQQRSSAQVASRSRNRTAVCD